MRYILGLIMVIVAIPLSGKTFGLQSPNKRLQVEIESGATLKWSIMHDSKQIMQPSEIDINGAYQGKASASPTKHYKTTFATPFYRQSSVTTEYNELQDSASAAFHILLFYLYYDEHNLANVP